MNSFQNNSNESILQGTQPSSVAVQPTGPVSRNQDSINDWHSKVGSFSDCLKDEESLWFGIWCCWIINSRTVHQFALEDSFKENCFFISAIIIFLILRFLSPILGISFAITAIVVLAWRRAKYRTSMRQKLSIPGTFADDLIIHAFCSCCAVCQEAREAKYAQYPRIDYCFGEPLLSREEAHDQAVNQTLNENPSLFGSCTSHIKTLSKTSKFIIFLCFIIALLTILIDLVSNSSANILVLLLIFTQPLAILYFVYWRERQQYAYLDYVVKTFAYGFWFSTFQSFILETILQDIASLIVYFTLTLTNANLSDLKSQQEYLKSHIFGVIIFIFFMAFVVAAGVEETMKHFVVRCCQFPSTLKDPHSVLVYLLAAALGFATAENIEYVFGAQVPVVPGLTVLEDELLVLLMRVLTPIHAICSVLQAVNYSKVLMGQSRMNLFQILFPAWMLHGTFDFVLFLLSALGFIYGISPTIYEVLSIVIAITISIGGGVWAYYSFKKVESDYRDGWQSMPGDEVVLNNL